MITYELRCFKQRKRLHKLNKKDARCIMKTARHLIKFIKEQHKL